MLPQSLGKIHQGSHIHLERVPHLVKAALKNGSHAAGDGGVEDQDVDNDALGLELVPQLGRVFDISNVAHDPSHLCRILVGALGVELVCRLLDGVGPAAKEDHAGCFRLDEASGNGEPDSGGAACDEDGTASLRQLEPEGRDAGVGCLVEGGDRGDLNREGGHAHCGWLMRGNVGESLIGNEYKPEFAEVGRGEGALVSVLLLRGLLTLVYCFRGCVLQWNLVSWHRPKLWNQRPTAGLYRWNSSSPASSYAGLLMAYVRVEALTKICAMSIAAPARPGPPKPASHPCRPPTRPLLAFVRRRFGPLSAAHPQRKP